MVVSWYGGAMPGPIKRICPSDLTFSAQMCLPFFFAETTPFEVLYYTILLYFTHSNARLVFPLSDQLWTSISQGQVKIFKRKKILLKDLSKISPMCLPVGLCPSDRRSYGRVLIGEEGIGACPTWPPPVGRSTSVPAPSTLPPGAGHLISKCCPREGQWLNCPCTAPPTFSPPWSPAALAYTPSLSPRWCTTDPVPSLYLGHNHV